MSFSDIKLDYTEQDNEKTIAAGILMKELQKGRLSGEQDGWLSEEDVKTHFESRFNA